MSSHVLIPTEALSCFIVLLSVPLCLCGENSNHASPPRRTKSSPSNTASPTSRANDWAGDPTVPTELRPLARPFDRQLCNSGSVVRPQHQLYIEVEFRPRVIPHQMRQIRKERLSLGKGGLRSGMSVRY